ncbi:MAG TPA: hypothetical protein VMM93_14655 [Vicinamibacterales bacterium]|nr:hypothetical protein [Vicinamibacterales bacterium]
MPERPARLEGLGLLDRIVDVRCPEKRIDAALQAGHLQVGRGRRGDQAVVDEHTTAVDADEPPGETHASCRKLPQADRPPIGAAHQLQRRLPARGRRIGHMVDRLVEDAHAIHPPADVPAPVLTRQAHVPANGQRDRTA